MDGGVGEGRGLVPLPNAPSLSPPPSRQASDPRPHQRPEGGALKICDLVGVRVRQQHAVHGQRGRVGAEQHRVAVVKALVFVVDLGEGWSACGV